MIYSLKGTLIHRTQNFAVVECGGVGYKCSTSLSSLRDMPQVGSEVKLYTYMAVREDAVELFGFVTAEELECFKILTSVSGVGSKVGIAVLSEFSPEQVAVCIASGDAKTLTKASGVGNKLAQRIILELKDKMKKLNVKDTGIKLPASKPIGFDMGNISNAVEALGVLGYSSDDVMPILSNFDGSLSVEELIHKTLLELGKK